MKANQLREKNLRELQDLRGELLREEFNLRMQKSLGQLSRPSEFQRIRREIARINTVLGEKRKEIGQ